MSSVSTVGEHRTNVRVGMRCGILRCNIDTIRVLGKKLKGIDRANTCSSEFQYHKQEYSKAASLLVDEVRKIESGNCCHLRFLLFVWGPICLHTQRSPGCKAQSYQ